MSVIGTVKREEFTIKIGSQRLQILDLYFLGKDNKIIGYLGGFGDYHMAFTLEDGQTIYNRVQTAMQNGGRIALERDEQVVKSEKVINIGPGVQIFAPIVIADDIENSFNMLMESNIDDTIKQLLSQLLKAVNEVNKQVSSNKAGEAEAMVRDVETLVKEVASSKPRRNSYEVSLKGLKQAAINIGEIAEPVLNIVSKLLPLLLS